nr:hypothetical protein [Candidatus Woesearchaeota archaeon]
MIEEKALDQIVDLELLEEACEGLRGGAEVILGVIGKIPAYRTASYEITNRTLILIYQKEFRSQSFPNDPNPMHLGIGKKSFLAIEEYLYMAGFIKERIYRKVLEDKKLNALKITYHEQVL